jgi:hypothetical protein
MKRYPTKGDVLKIKKSQYLVVDCHDLSGDRSRCYQINTIKDTDCGKPNPKINVFLLTTEDSSENDQLIKLDDIQLIKSVKIKQSIIYSY